MKPQTAKQLQAQIDAWNEAYPVGTEVTCRKDDGTVVQTTTTSRAEILSGHTAVIWMVGIRGCYALSRVNAIEA